MKKIKERRQHTQTESSYRCGSEGPVNNGLKNTCEFEGTFPEGNHHCPVCGTQLLRVPSGPTVSQLLRRGQIKEAKEQGEKK